MLVLAVNFSFSIYACYELSIAIELLSGSFDFNLNNYFQIQMSQVRKRPLTSSENATPTQLKQTKLSFGPQSNPKLETPTKDQVPGPANTNDYFRASTAPLRGTTWMRKIQTELNKPYMQKVFKRIGDEVKAVSF